MQIQVHMQLREMKWLYTITCHLIVLLPVLLVQNLTWHNPNSQLSCQMPIVHQSQ